MSVDREALICRQRALGDFGEFVMRSDDLHAVLQEGCRLVAEALDTPLAKILEIERQGNSALVCAGVGWRPGIVGDMRLPLGEHSSETFAIRQGRPVVTQDVAVEDRFEFPQFMKDHGVVAIVNVPIFLPGGTAFGLLQVDATEPRAFGDEDIEFLRTYCTVLGPVIDRLRTAAKLGSSEERFRLVVENALDHVIVLSDADDVITAWFPGATAVLGWSEEEMIGRPLATIFTPEDRASEAPRWETERAIAAGTAPNVRWHVTKDGKRVFLDGQTIVLRERGEVSGFLKISQDITERKRAEERQSVLQAELQHRVRNVLAMIASVVGRGDIRGTAEELRDALSGRIAAMARTQALITRGEGMGVDLEALIRDELLPQAEGEHIVQVGGPPILLAPKAAEVLTLAIHELATNALKYGALSWSAGRIDVAWRSIVVAGQDWLELDWTESGGRLAPATDRRLGFGTELITRRVPYELRGRGEVELRAEGLRCRIAFPLTLGDSVLETSVPASPRGHDGAAR